MKTKTKILILGILTLVGFSLLAWPILIYLNKSVSDVLVGNKGLLFQTFIGLTYGLFSGLLAWAFISTHFMAKIRWHYASLTKRLKLGMKEIIFLSFCAGIGEELLFRGSLQPIMGIWFTSFIFVALHGYLNPFKPKLFLYGMLMFGVILGLGYMCIKFGILTSMAAHFMIDVVLLIGLVYFPGLPPTSIENEKDIDYES